MGKYEAETGLMYLDTSDGMNTLINSIKEETEIRYSNGKMTKLYTANLFKKQKGEMLADLDKVCFELPADINIENSAEYLDYLVSMVYQNYKSEARNQTYFHMGVLNYDENNQVQCYRASENVLAFVKNNLDTRLAKENDRARQIDMKYEEYYKQMELRKQDDYKRMNEKREAEAKAIKNEKWNNPIFQEQPDGRGGRQYQLYTQEATNDYDRLSGYSTLKNVEYVNVLKHGDQTIGYVYTANVKNKERYDEVENFAAIDPKVCFELPCPIEELNMRFQSGDKDVIRYLGALLSTGNQARAGVKTNGEQTWIGRVKQEMQGEYSLDYNVSAYLKAHIDNENAKIRAMNTPAQNRNSSLEHLKYDGQEK